MSSRCRSSRWQWRDIVDLDLKHSFFLQCHIGSVVHGQFRHFLVCIWVCYSCAAEGRLVGRCMHYVYIISKQLTISTRWWWKVVLHYCTILGAGLQMTLLKAVRVYIRRKGSIADSTLQIIREATSHESSLHGLLHA